MTTIVCRCEDVTSGDIAAAVASGACTAQEIKFHTRAGMGFCQGRVCREVVESVIAAATGTPAAETRSTLTVHLPVRPTALADLALGEEA